MSDINTKIIKILEGIGDEGVAIIRSELAVSKKGFIFNASFNTSKQTASDVKAKGDKYTLVIASSDYFESLEQDKGYKGFVDIGEIKEWASNKLGDEKAAWPVKREIELRGNRVFKRTREGIELDEIREFLVKRIQDELNKLGDLIADQIRTSWA